MAGFSWSKEQLNAITSKNNNYLVSAAAGSGKTTVLVERIIRRITDKEEPVSVDRFLVMTFTNAAASEMKERILNAIEKEIDQNPDNKYLQRQKSLIKSSNIMTIDAFCLSLLRANFEEADIDPSFDICDDADNRIIQEDVFNSLLENHLDRYYNENADEEVAFFHMLKKFGGNSGTKLFEHVQTICKEMDSRPFPKNWLKNAVSIYNNISLDNFDSCDWVCFLKNEVINNIKTVLNRANSLLAYVESVVGVDACYRTIIHDVEAIEQLLENCEGLMYDELGNLLTGFKFKNALSCKAGTVDAEIKEYVYDLRKVYTDRVKETTKLFQLGNSESIVSDMNSMSADLNAFTDFVIEYRESYFNEKKKRNVFTFSDVESLCLKILIKHNENGEPVVDENGYVYSNIANQYANQYAEILVDEYQDSNDLQEVLINAISSREKGNVFMVGDVKQSIYRFRQSNPKLFIDKFNRYDNYICGSIPASDSDGNKIMLDRNYRSANGVLRGINDVFFAIMKTESGEVDYNENESLKPGRGLENETEPDIEVHIVNHKQIKDDLDENFKGSIEKSMIEADVLVDRVREFIEGDKNKGVESIFVTEKDGTKRPAQYGDVAVLSRGMKNVSTIFENAFINAGIPVSVDAVSEYFYRSEINTILSALNVILNTQDDISVLSLLRSPLYKFSAEDIARIRIGHKDVGIYTAMKAYCATCSDKTATKVQKVMEDVESWKKYEKLYTISELIWFLYQSTGFYEQTALMSEGEMRQANLRTFFEKAHAFEQNKFATLSGFVDYINNLKDAELSFADAEAISETTDAVRIMSIHKSKGLEFPIVLLVCCEKEFNRNDLNNFLIVQNEFGVGVSGGNSVKNIKWNTPFREAIKKKIQFELYSEEMRILYVGMTRAKEKLIISGCIGKPDKFIEGLKLDIEADDFSGRGLSPQNVLSYKSYLSWVCAALAFKFNDVFYNVFNRMISGEICSSQIDDVWKVFYHEDAMLFADPKGLDSAEIDEISRNTCNDRLVALEAQALALDENDKKYSDFKRELSWVYDSGVVEPDRLKITVSELTAQLNVLTDRKDDGVVQLYKNDSVKNIVVPSFGEKENKLTATLRGQIIHTMIEHVDYLKVMDSPRYFDELKYELKDRFLINLDDLNELDITCLVRYSKTNLFARISDVIRNGKPCFRERPFLMQFVLDKYVEQLLSDAVGVNEEAVKILKSQSGVFVQGVIDLFFVEDGEIVLVDFKTNIVKDGVDSLKKKYAIQFLMYKYALERVTGMHVKEGIMYLLSNKSDEIKDDCVRMF